MPIYNRTRLANLFLFTLQIRDDTARLRRDLSEKLKHRIADKDMPLFERRIYIHLPKENEHEQHATGEVTAHFECIKFSNYERKTIA